MKKILILLAILLTATGCQKISINKSKEPIVKHTDIVTAGLAEVQRDAFLFRSQPRDGEKTNLFLRSSQGETVYLPAGYYYVPASGPDDTKPAILPETLLVQKGSKLAFFATTTKKLTPISAISVPEYSQVAALYSRTSGDNMLIALVDKDTLSPKPHPSLLYKVVISHGEASIVRAEKITNPFADLKTEMGSTFPIATSIYDGLKNRVLSFEFNQDLGYTGLNIARLDNEERRELQFSEPMHIAVSGRFITLQPGNEKHSTISVVDLNQENLQMQTYQVPAFKKTAENAFETYTYLGEESLLGLIYKETGPITFIMLKKYQNSFKPIHEADLPYVFVKRNQDNLYLIMTSLVGGTTPAKAAVYNFASNSFTNFTTFPGELSTGEIEFFR